MAARLKIIFYSATVSKGGAERVQVVLASGFAARGHDVVVAVDRPSPSLPLPPGIQEIVLGGGHMHDVLALYRLFRREKPDAVISALAYCNLKATLAALASGYAGRLVLAYHGFAASEWRGLSQIGYRLVPLLSRLSAATVAVSDMLKDDLLKTFRAAPGRTVRIYNPVHIGDAPRHVDEADLMARPPLVLAIGRLVPEKGFLTLLRAFAQLQDSRARLVILGTGPQKAELDAQIARLGLQDRVTLPGHVAEPWSFFNEARCLVSASHNESFGLVLLEAMAHGLPVVSTRCGATPEVLENGRYGRLVPVGDVTLMAQAMAEALAHPGDPAPRIARAASFSIDVALDGYQRVIDAITITASQRPSLKTRWSARRQKPESP
ncbi:MAG: glycosyl transferase group 1 [Hyphomicrobiales bacterium]|nr:glycosyl transferase group 1 [Hyphomicrobiales bacterium]